MTYQMTADDGSLLDAHFDVDGHTVVFHSRGGGGAKAKNTHYPEALRLLLQRLRAADVPVRRAWVDSSRVQALPIGSRIILDEGDWDHSVAEQVTRMNSRMQLVGRSPSATSDHGNQTKRIRLELLPGTTAEKIVEAAKAMPSKKDFRSEQRLPVGELAKITAEHLWNAAEKLRSGYKDHAFGESTDYDVLLPDGTRLPPKALFGVAGTEALGFELLPVHFVPGDNTPCFRQLQAAGYRIVPKEGSTAPPVQAPEPPAKVDERDPEFEEGTPQLRMHLRRERRPELRAAKKAEFRRTHGGKLLCERCGLDPILHFGTDDGEACIEVHHEKVQVQHMEADHISKLADVKCLCANCHRLVHRQLRQALDVG